MRTPAGISAAFYFNQCGRVFDFHEHELKSIIPQDHRIFCID
jgi:Fe2+ or Zn2+ uptake regulation protein